MEIKITSVTTQFRHHSESLTRQSDKKLGRPFLTVTSTSITTFKRQMNQGYCRLPDNRSKRRVQVWQQTIAVEHQTKRLVSNK